MSEAELPRAVALAWGVAAHPQRGPKRELSLERIVDVAIALADASGLPAVSMAAIAGELGVSTMALYRYVSAKDDLVVLMQEAAIGVPPASIAEAEGWRSRLQEWSRAQSALFTEHPWLLDVPVTGTPITPNNLAWMDEGLAALEGIGLDDRERTDSLLAVVAQVRWHGVVERGMADAARAADSSVGDYDRATLAALAELITPESLPHVRRVFSAGVLQEDAAQGYDAFGLARVLDGVAAFLAERPAASATPAPEIDPRVRKDPKVKDATARRREAEKRLREERKREREAMKAAAERLAR